MEFVTLELTQLKLDPAIQPRAEMDNSYTNDLCEDLLEGANLPPMTVFFDGTDYWPADGWHRWFAHQKAGWTEILVELRDGGKREAMLHSVGANATHGKRRTNADKRKAVTTLLEDEEWARWSDRQIAQKCCVCQPLVSDVRRDLTDRGHQFPATRTCSDGREMNVSQIGANRGQEFQQASAEATPGDVQQEVVTTEPEAATVENTVAQVATGENPPRDHLESQANTSASAQDAGGLEEIIPLVESEADGEPEYAAAETTPEEISQVEVYEIPAQETETPSPEVADDIPTLKATVAELQAALQAKELELQAKDKIIEDLENKVWSLEEENSYLRMEMESFSNEDPCRETGAKRKKYSYATALQI